MSSRGVVILALGGTLGCSSGGGGTLSTCELADLCAQVTAERVSATCAGGGALSSSYGFQPGGPGAIASDMCVYAGEAPFLIYRQCFTVQRDALVAYLAEHNATQSDDIVTEEVAGIGDIAFFRYSTESTSKNLVILSGNNVITLYDGQFVDPASDKACMTELAGDAIAAR